MLCRIFFALVVLCASGAARAHFVFVVPDSSGTKAQLILSETLEADGDVNVDLADSAKLTRRAFDGKESPLTIEKAEHALGVMIPAGTRLVFGSADFGVTRRGEGDAFLLTYYPKTVIGDAFGADALVGEAAPVELVAVGSAGKLRFKLLARGKPVEAGEITVIPPNGEQKKSAIGPDGLTVDTFAASGRYGAWARHFEPAAGEREGKKYAQIRRYATLVTDVNIARHLTTAPASAKASYPTTSPANVRRLTPMPEPASSFGAVACDGWLYLYGGHISRTHTYSTAAVSGRFSRIKMDGGTSWEELPAGPALQGMNLASHGGKVYRIGGMQPRNKPGDKADNFSVADCAVYDPAAAKWTAITPLPEPRSSHDVVVIGDKLIAVGGWTMTGRDGDTRWCDNTLVMDLRDPAAAWRPVKQPFVRRALIAAAFEGKVYVLGGFTEESDPFKCVDVFDPATEKWTTGPEFPGKPRNGFAPAACVLNGRLYLSVADGSMFRLDSAGKAWETAAATTPRIVHRLIPDGQTIRVLGGADKGENFDLVEVIDLGSVDRR